MEHRPLLRSGRAVAMLALGFCGILIPSTSFAASVTLTPNADAELRQASPLGVFGSGTTMVSGGLGSNAGNTLRRSLLRFELADALPSGATITAVELTVQVVLMTPPAPQNSNFELRRLLRPWRESAVTWTWADNPITPWGTGGAGRDDDAVPTGSASVFVSGLGQYVFASTPALVADVQLWVNDPSSNAGWLLRSDTESPFTARHFGTRENNSDPAQLTISYEVSTTPDPVRIGELTIQEGALSFSFDAQPGVGYRVEFRDESNTGDWQTITNLPPPETSGRLNFTHPIKGAAGYFRVKSTTAP